MRGAETLWLKPGQVLIKEGEISRDLFVHLSGELIVDVGGKKIATVTVYGEVLGELGALSGKPRTATVIARTASEVLVVKNAGLESLKNMPSIREKIDTAISRRYSVARNKIIMYSSIISTIRRGILQEAMREGLESKKKAGPLQNAGSVRYHLRQRIDEILALHQDVDDPRILDRIAMEYGVGNIYRDRLAAKPWLDDALVAKMNSIDNTWRLLADRSGAETVIEKAHTTIAISNLLSEYEKMPGIKREMDIIRMEGIIPLKAKIEALKEVIFVQRAERAIGERERMAIERGIKLAIDGVSADAGNDVTLIINAARELKVEDEYEQQIRNLVGMTEIVTDYVDIADVKADGSEIGHIDEIGAMTTKP